MKELFNNPIDWIRTWDFMSIFYGIVASVIFAFILQWIGVFSSTLRWIKVKYGLKKYRERLKEECSTLIVIGRRSGFTITGVYVDLDIARSDLNQQEKKEEYSRIRPTNSYVLVGGPGAGKSTTVKKIILDKLEKNDALPFFIRLREYYGNESIEEYLIEKFKEVGIPHPEEVLRFELSKNTVCVLDGLDEVRPQLKEKIYSHINQFYARHFRDTTRQLIVSCRKEAYRDYPLDLPEIWEVRPLTDEQIKRFADKWPLGYPKGKSKDTFWRDLGAAEKILQLARSPLLLVGGLMQYTESNQGIPEERFEYLQRVAKWLVADWATAQGHPPDPNRPVYDRILAKIAFYMHSNQLSELSIPNCRKLLEECLPTFGHDKDDAKDIIESIATKTGILVREGGNNVIFAQFGLQEYFTSLEVISSVGIEGVPTLSPLSWWREPILLTAAQQREPTRLLDVLFSYAPLLAVAAVAECPTPPISMQSKAIEVCLTFIDSMDKAVGSATATLMRKVKGDQEELLLQELAKRLKANKEEINSLVGLSLAIAGTPKATELLATHPDLWGTCLKEAGYLSTNFENLLVEWIQNGTPDQSTRAIDMIVSRLSADRMNQLIGILSSLKREQAEHLSALLLEELIKENPRVIRRYGDSNLFEIISKCSLYISNINLFDKKDDMDPFTDANRILIKKAILVSQKRKIKDSSQLFSIICNANKWSFERSQIIIFSCACLSLIIYLGQGYGLPYFHILLPFIMSIFLVAISFPYSPPPWFEELYFLNPTSYNLKVNYIVFFLGIYTYYAIGYRIQSETIEISSSFYFFPILMIISGYIKEGRYYYFSDSYSSGGINTFPLAGIIYASLLLLFILIDFFIPNIQYINTILVIISIIYFFCLMFFFIRLLVNWLIIKNI